MNEKNTGGPAFPVPAEGNYIPDCQDPDGVPMREFPGHPGMTLRDWFAGQAVAGMCANPHASQVADDGGFSMQDVRKSFADSAYAVADAMIKARDQ